MASAITSESMTLIGQEFCLSWNGTHGARHWARVRANGLVVSTLCQEAGEAFDENLTKAQASERIDELQARTGRGQKT